MRLLLCDGTNIVLRCASVQAPKPPAVPTPEQRQQVIATAGRMIRRAAGTVGASHLIVAFDAPGGSFRKARYPAYKAHRAARQVDTESWVLDAGVAFSDAGIKCVMAAEYEADDVIATLAHRATAAGEKGAHHVHVLSNDSDLLALAANPQVTCWQFATKADKDAALTAAAADGPHPWTSDRGGFVPSPIVARSSEWICQKYGLETVAQLTDYKALVGEAGDGVAGVHGVGPKKAKVLLAEYGSIERMIEYGMIAPADAAHARTVRDLLELRTDAPIPPIAPAACRIAGSARRVA